MGDINHCGKWSSSRMLPLMLWWSLAWFPYFYSDGHTVSMEMKPSFLSLKKESIRPPKVVKSMFYKKSTKNYKIFTVDLKFT